MVKEKPILSALMPLNTSVRLWPHVSHTLVRLWPHDLSLCTLVHLWPHVSHTLVHLWPHGSLHFGTSLASWLSALWHTSDLLLSLTSVADCGCLSLTCVVDCGHLSLTCVRLSLTCVADCGCAVTNLCC